MLQRMNASVREADADGDNYTYNWHLLAFRTSVVMVAETLCHDIIQAIASPE